MCIKSETENDKKILDLVFEYARKHPVNIPALIEYTKKIMSQETCK